MIKIKEIVYIGLISFLLTISMMLVFIPILENLKYGQIVREEGPKLHYKKDGTPTMGGIPVIIAFVLSIMLYFSLENFNGFLILLIMIPFIGYGIIGLFDDLLIIKKKSNDGLNPKVKMLLESCIAILFFVIYLNMDYDTTLSFLGVNLDLKGFYGVLILLILTSSSNAVNLTDGLDGLAGGTILIAFSSFLAIAIKNNNMEMIIILVCIITTLMGFLVFNINPAKIFMGDTGSLALGGLLGSIAILMKQEVTLLIIGFPFIIETLSVIIQVSYFKISKGKRIFKMAPIHHSFELMGMKEKNIVYLFWLIGIVSGIIGFMLAN